MTGEGFSFLLALGPALFAWYCIHWLLSRISEAV